MLLLDLVEGVFLVGQLFKPQSFSLLLEDLLFGLLGNGRYKVGIKCVGFQVVSIRDGDGVDGLVSQFL